jgi:hypothetical protein
MKYVIDNLDPLVCDWYFLQAVKNADGSIKKDEDGTVHMVNCVTRSINGDKVDRFLASYHSASEVLFPEIDAIKQKINLIENTIGSASGGGSASTSSLVINSISGKSDVTIIPTKYNVYNVVLSADTTTFMINSAGLAPTNLAEIRIYLKQGTGSNTVAWPENVKWLDGIKPVTSFTKDSIDVVQLSSVDGGKTWLGSMVNAWS